MIKNLDFMFLEEFLAEEEKIIRDTTRRFVEKEVLPIIEDHYDKGTFPPELIPKIAQIGPLGTTIPPEYGRAGASHSSYGQWRWPERPGNSWEATASA